MLQNVDCAWYYYTIRQKKGSHTHVDARESLSTGHVLVQLPIHLNEIVDICDKGRVLICVTIREPHNLWVDGRRSILPTIDCGHMARRLADHVADGLGWPTRQARYWPGRPCSTTLSCAPDSQR